MKYMNHAKSGFLAMAFACAGMCFTACEDDVVINVGNTDKLETVDGVYGFVKSAAGARQLTPITVFGTKAATGHLYFELSQAAEQDVTVTFKVDEEALKAYNTANGTSYQMYPGDLSLSDGGVATIKAGEKASQGYVQLNIGAGGTVGETYAVAVSASANNGVEVAANNQTYIYLVKPQAAVPDDIRKGDVQTMCFVEVNDENILNCGEYTMKQSGMPFFDIVSIFAANINVDSRTGRVHVYCNDQVTFLLDNVDKFVRPLQAKGIKVNLSILGNHDEAGMGNLSAEAAADFAKELKAYLDIYGLDGVDFDDEYTSYKDQPSAGFEPRSRANYARLVYECRQLFGDKDDENHKLIGIYEYNDNFIDSPTGTVNEKTVGQLVDYMTYGCYQNQADYMTRGKGREVNFTGLEKSQYCPTPLKISDDLNGGWSSFRKDYIQDMYDSGYKLQMFYNPKATTYNYSIYFSTVSSIIFGDDVVWSGNCYTRTSDVPIKKGVDGPSYGELLGEWKVVSDNSLYVYIDENNDPRWWDWGGSKTFDIRIEEKVAGESYNIYGWGTYPDVTEKYPLEMKYNDGNLYIPVPQTIHEADATDPETWKMCWGTYASRQEVENGPVEFYWRFYESAAYEAPVTSMITADGIQLVTLSGRWSIDPCHEVNGELVPPSEEKYHISGNYRLVKK